MWRELQSELEADPAPGNPPVEETPYRCPSVGRAGPGLPLGTGRPAEAAPPARRARFGRRDGPARRHFPSPSEAAAALPPAIGRRRHVTAPRDPPPTAGPAGPSAGTGAPSRGGPVPGGPRRLPAASPPRLGSPGPGQRPPPPALRLH